MGGAKDVGSVWYRRPVETWKKRKTKKLASISSARTRHPKWEERDVPETCQDTSHSDISISLYYTGTYSHHFCPIYHNTIQLQPTIGRWRTDHGQNYIILEVLPGRRQSCTRTRYSDDRHLSATAYQSNPTDMTCYSTVSALPFTNQINDTYQWCAQFARVIERGNNILCGLWQASRIHGFEVSSG